MLQKWKLTKISFTKPHENITYKGSNKANAQDHTAIRKRYYICYNTDMLSHGITHRFHNVQAWQPLKMERNIHTHITVNYTNTHEN